MPSASPPPPPGYRHFLPNESTSLDDMAVIDSATGRQIARFKPINPIAPEDFAQEELDLEAIAQLADEVEDEQQDDLLDEQSDGDEPEFTEFTPDESPVSRSENSLGKISPPGPSPGPSKDPPPNSEDSS